MSKKLIIFLLPICLLANEDLEKIKERIEKLKSEELGILGEIEKIDFEIILLEEELWEMKAKEKTLQSIINRKEKELKEVKLQFEKEKENLASIFSLIYMFKYFSPFQLILTKPKEISFTDLFRIIYISNLRKKKLEKLHEIYQNILKKEEEYKKAQAEHSKAIQLRSLKFRVLNDKKKEKRAFLENIRRERERYLALLTEMEKASKSITETISKMEPIITYSGISIKEKKGELPWPLEGQIIQRFGLVKNKKYNTVVKNNGIVIYPKTDEVKAIWWGKVIFADYFEGYGNVVIIEHQDRIYSIYGYLGPILVKKGEQINTGQPIAKVGSSGLVAEGAIYFEIREGNDPENPLLWLSKK